MICPHGSSVGELLDPPCHLCRIEELEAQIAALKAATVRPNPADFGAWSQESLAKFAKEVWEENLRLRFQLDETVEAVATLKQICRDAYEVWAGSEGIPEPVYASEAYLLQLLLAMRDEVQKGL